MPLEPKVLSTAPLENSDARYSGPYVFLKPTQSVWQMDWTEEDKLYRPGRHTGLFGRSFLCHTCILPSSLHSALGNAQNARRGVNLVQTVCVTVRCLTPDADADFLSSCGHSRDPALQDKRVPIIDSRRRTIPTADRQSCRRCVLDRRLCMCPVQCSSYL